MTTLSSNNYHLPLTFNQILELVKQLPSKQKIKLIKTLLPETIIKSEGFELSEEQILLLDKRSKTPLEKFISAKDAMKLLKQKHGI